jgi:hypothetical protein
VNRRSSHEAEDGIQHGVSLTVIDVDIGKEIFHVVGLGVDGKIAFRKKIRRLGLKDAFEKLATLRPPLQL